MASGLENIETIESPFRRFVTTIGVFPTAFTDAMTYYECLAYLVKYLEETVIPAVNENAEALEELQKLYIQLKSYVDNYFENLDVQEEINNKLDQMAEDGELADIIAQYLGLAGVLAFATVADMKEATNLVNGSYARTLGFHTLNDGGGATYYITDSGTANEMDVIAVGSLYANLIKGENINVKQVGAKGDGVNDDTANIQRAINIIDSVNVPAGIYMINAVTKISVKSGTKLLLDNNAIIKALPNSNDSYNIIEIKDVSNVSIVGGTLQGDRDDHTGETGQWGHCIKITDSSNIYLENIYLIDAWGDGISARGFTNLTLKDLRIKNVRRNGISVIGGTHLFSNNLLIEDVSGHNPQSGIDIEPDANTDVVKDINFENTIIRNCLLGFTVSLQNLDGTSGEISIDVNNLKVYNTPQGVYLIKPETLKGYANFNNLFLKENNKNGIIFSNYNYSTDFKTTFDNILIQRSAIADTGNTYSAIFWQGTSPSGNIDFKNIAVYQTNGITVNDFYSAVTSNDIAIIDVIHKTNNYNISNITNITLIDSYNVFKVVSSTASGTIGGSETRTFSMRNSGSTSQSATISAAAPIGYHCKFLNFSQSGNYVINLPADTYCKALSASSAPAITLSVGATLELERITSTEFIINSMSGTVTV